MDETLLDELKSPAPIRPENFGITVKEYMQAKKCTESVARRILEEMVRSGVLVSHTMNTSVGCHPVVFCRPGEWKE
jgi:hypothetical protein